MKEQTMKTEQDGIKHFNELIESMSVCIKSIKLMNDVLNELRIIVPRDTLKHASRSGDSVQHALACTNADLLACSKEIYSIMEIFNPKETKIA